MPLCGSRTILAAMVHVPDNYDSPQQPIHRCYLFKIRVIISLKLIIGADPLFRELFTRLKQHFTSRSFLYADLPYLMIGAIFLMFTPYKYHGWIVYYILAYVPISIVINVLDWDKIRKKHNQNSGSR